MANPQSPGVYVNIIDKSQYANIVIGDKSAITILAESGELFVPHLITSRQEFVNFYGFPKSRSAFYAYLLLSLSPVWISRIAVINPNTSLDPADDPYATIISERTGTGSVKTKIMRQIKAFQIAFTTVWSDIALSANEEIYLPASIKEYAGVSPVYADCSDLSDSKGNYFWAELPAIPMKFDKVFKETVSSKLGLIESGGSYILIDDTDGTGLDTSNISPAYTAVSGDKCNFYLTLNVLVGVTDEDKQMIDFTVKYPGKCDEFYVKVYPIHEVVTTYGDYYVDYVDLEVLKKGTVIETYKSLDLYNTTSNNYYYTVIDKNSQNIVVSNNFADKLYDFAADDSEPNITTFDTAFVRYTNTEYDGLDWEKYPLTDSLMESALSYVGFTTVATDPDDIFQSAYSSTDKSDYVAYAGSDVVEAQTLTAIKSGVVNSVNYVFDIHFGDELYDFVRLSAPFIDVSSAILTGMTTLADMRTDFFFIYDAYEPTEADFGSTACIASAKAIEANLPSTWKGAIAWSGGIQYNTFTSAIFPQYASFAIMRAMAYTDGVSYPWYAPAGQPRGQGVVPEMTKVLYNPNKKERDILMGFPGRINVIRNISGVGVVVYGQKTLSSVASAFDRINVARLALYMNKQLKIMNNDLIFDLATDDLWFMLRNRLNSVMTFIQTNKGIKKFEIANVTTSDEQDRNELHAVIALIPTKAVEKIIIDCIFAPQGATLSNYIES